MSSEQQPPSPALIESFLELEEIEPDLYRSSTGSLWKPPHARGVFGGQVVGHALTAATKTVPEGLSVHSLHSYFLLAGDHTSPIIYRVLRVRDGRSFATRTVRASQKGRSIFTCTCSFQVPTDSKYEHQYPMPEAPDPDTLMGQQQLFEEWSKRTDLPKQTIEQLKLLSAAPLPIDIRRTKVIRPKDFVSPDKSPSTKMLWMRSVDKLNDDPRLHQSVLAYSSDHQLLTAATRPFGITKFTSPEYIQMVVSLDHTVWFHAPFRADEWLLYVLESPRFGNERGLAFGRIYTRDGRLVASAAQEGLVRIGERQNSNDPLKAKL